MPQLPAKTAYSDPSGRIALTLLLALPGPLIVGFLFLTGLFLNLGRWEPILHDLAMPMCFALIAAPFASFFAKGWLRLVAYPSGLLSVSMLIWIWVVTH